MWGEIGAERWKGKEGNSPTTPSAIHVFLEFISFFLISFPVVPNKYAMEVGGMALIGFYNAADLTYTITWWLGWLDAEEEIL